MIKRNTIRSLSICFCTLAFFALAPAASATYAPGETLNPSCGPGDPGCTISPITLVSNGGTNITTYALGDILYASGTTTLTKLPISADGRVLKIAGGIPGWGNDNGGTNFLASEQGLHLDGVTDIFSLALDGSTLSTSPLGLRIAATYPGQQSIVSLGNITAGHWSADPIDADNGGTGIVSYNTGDVLFAAGTSTLERLPVGTENTILKVSGGLPSWQTDAVGPSYLASGQGLQLSTSTNTFLIALDGTSLAQSAGGLRLSASYPGQSSIATVGTINSGIWHGTPVAPQYGGTGQSVYTIGDLLYASGPSTLSKIPIGSANDILKVSGGLPIWEPESADVAYLASGLGLVLSTSTNTFLIALDGASLSQSPTGLRLSSTYPGQTSINTLGTVTTGHWSGDTIDIANGGTGLTNTPGIGEILIGNGTGYSTGNITGSEGVTVTNSTGTINVSLSVATIPTVTSPVSNDYLPIYASGTLLRRKISFSDLFAGVLGSLNYQGAWNANSNSPTLLDTDCVTSTKGRYYVVTTAGTTTLGGISLWGNNDWTVCNGTVWEKINNAGNVSSVFGRTGTITAQAADYNALQITNVPAGSLSSVTVQDALNELATEKEPAIASSTTSEYYRGDKTWQTLNTAAVTENPSALYYTDARARAAVNGNADGLSYDSGSGILSLAAGRMIPRIASSTNWDTAYGWGNHASAGYLTGLSGDGTTVGSGLAGLTLATVNGNSGTFGSPSTVGSFTVNAKGLITAASSSVIVINESAVSGLTGDLANKLASALPTGNIFIGDAGGIASAKALSLSAAAGTFGISSAGTLTMPNADTATRGLLTSTDWNSFNNKQASLGFTPENITNKTLDINVDATSDTKYPSAKAVKTYADSLALGLNWQQPVELVNVVGESATPIVSPKNLDGYIISPGGDWTSVNPTFAPGDLLQYQSSSWVKIKSLVTGDRFAIAFKSTTTPSGPFTGKKNYRATFDNTINGSNYTYTLTAPANNDALYVQNTNAYYRDISFVYSTNQNAWIQLSATISISYANGLSLSANTLSLGALTSDWNQTGHFAITTAGDMNLNGGNLNTTATTSANVFNSNATTLNIGGAATNINLGAAGAALRGNGALTLISGTGANLNVDSGTTGTLNLGTSNDGKTINLGTGNGGNVINIGTDNVGTDTISIGSPHDAFSLTSSGLNISNTGAISGITSLDGINFSSSTLTFPAAGTITSSGLNTLTMDTGGNGTLNLGTGNNAKTIAIGTGNAGNTILIGTNNTVADSITMGSGLDLFSLSSAGLNVTTSGALSGISTLNGVSIATSSLGFTATGTITSTGANAITLDSGTTGAVNIATGNNAKTVNIATNNKGNSINIGTDNTIADTIAIGSALDTLTLSSSGLNVSAIGGLSGVSSIDTIAVSPTSIVFAATGTISSTDGSAMNVDSSGNGSINIGTSASAKTITIGNGSGSTALEFNAGSGNIDIGANAVARTINIGTGAGTAQNINLGGSGANVIGIGNTQSGGSIALGNAMTTGNITIGGSGAQTGTITIGGGTGVQTLNLGTGDTGNKTINIGTGNAATNTINIGTNTAGVDVLDFGTSADQFTLTSSGLNVSALGALSGVTALNSIGFTATSTTFAGAGTISSTGANALTLDSGTTGALNIGTGSFAKNITIGNTAGATGVDINAGTGNINIGANATVNTINLGTGAGVVKTINVGGTGANIIAIGNTQTAGSISLGAGMTTGSINIGGTGAQTGAITIGGGTGTQTITLGGGTVGTKTVNIGVSTALNNINIGTDNTTPDNIAIGSSLDQLVINSTGFNVSAIGALSGITSLDGIGFNATSTTFPGVGNITSAGASALTLDSGTSGALNIGTGNVGKLINLGTGSGGNTIAIATDNTSSDTINIGSSHDLFTLNSSGLNVSDLGALTGVSAIDGVTHSASAITFPGPGSITTTGGNTLTLDAGATSTINIGTGVSPKTLNIGGGIGGDAIRIGTNDTATDTITIGSSKDNFTLNSNGINISSSGSLTGVTNINSFAVSTSSITFGADGTLASGDGSSLTIDSGTTGALNLGTGNNAKTIDIGTGNAGDIINIATNNTIADAITIGSALDSFVLNSSGLNVTSGGALSGVTSLDTINVTPASLTFAATGTITAANGNTLTLDTTTNGPINIGTSANAKIVTIGNLTGASGVVINAGTGNVDIGTNAIANVMNLGTGAGVVKTINIGGTGANVIGLGNAQAGGSIAIGSAMTSGTITIGGTGAQTGNINLGIGTGIQTINLGSGGTSKKTLNLATGNGGNIVNIATDNTATDTINIGSVNDTLSILSSGFNVSSLGALTGVSSIDNIGFAPNTLTFTGSGGIFATGTNSLTLDSGTTGTVNLGTGNNAKTINLGTGNAGDTINIGTNNTIADTIAIGSALDAFSLTSSGINISTGGALTGVTLLNTFALGTTSIAFNATGTLSSGGTAPLTIDSNSTGALNLGTGNNAKTINIGTGNAGNIINIGTNNAIADTISIGSALDALSLSSTGLNVNTTGDLTGVDTIDTIVFNATSTTFAGAGNVLSAGSNALTLDSGTTGGINIGTNANGKSIVIGNGTGATDITINSGTGGIDIGTNAPLKTITIGTSTPGTATTSVSISATTGGLSLAGLLPAANGNFIVCINNTTKKLFIGGASNNCNPSTARLKHDITDIALGLDTAMQLRPVSYTYNLGNQKALGFIAEDFAKIDERLINRDDGGLPFSINSDYVIPILTKSIQQLNNKFDLFISQSGISLSALNQLTLTGGLHVESEVDLGKDSVGEAVILPGTNMINVTFVHPYMVMPVVTISKMTKGYLSDYYVDDVSPTGFSIKIEPYVQKAMEFSWHAFGSPDGVRLFSDGSSEDLNATSSRIQNMITQSDQPVTITTTAAGTNIVTGSLPSLTGSTTSTNTITAATSTTTAMTEGSTSTTTESTAAATSTSTLTPSSTISTTTTTENPTQTSPVGTITNSADTTTTSEITGTVSTSTAP